MATDETPGRIQMAHYACTICDMTATVVKNEAAKEAWAHHMAEHHEPRAFEMWTWQVVSLFDELDMRFDSTDDPEGSPSSP